MFTSPYETLACRSHRIGDVEKLADELLIEGSLYPYAARVFFVTEENGGVSPFSHPIVRQRNNQPVVVADVRGAARVNRDGAGLIGSLDYQYTTARCRLMDEFWIDGNTKDLMNLGEFQIRLFARMMAENLGRRMNLDGETQLRLQIISAIYYQGLFATELTPTLSDEDVVTLSRRASRATMVPVERIIEILDATGPIYDLASCIEAMKQHGGSVRLSKLSVGLVYTMLGGLWFGANAVENMAVALEHPPTFCAMAYLAVNNRGYRKTILGQLAERIDRRGDLSKPFSKHVSGVLAE